VTRYIEVILDVPPRNVVDKINDVLISIALHFTPEHKQVWFTHAFAKIPGYVLTEEEKHRHLAKVLQPAKKGTLEDNFDIIAKRARNAINRGN
jgi:hypothetical protein